MSDIQKFVAHDSNATILGCFGKHRRHVVADSRRLRRRRRHLAQFCRVTARKFHRYCLESVTHKRQEIIRPDKRVNMPDA